MYGIVVSNGSSGMTGWDKTDKTNNRPRDLWLPSVWAHPCRPTARNASALAPVPCWSAMPIGPTAMEMSWTDVRCDVGEVGMGCSCLMVISCRIRAVSLNFCHSSCWQNNKMQHRQIYHKWLVIIKHQNMGICLLLYQHHGSLRSGNDYIVTRH